MREPRRRREQPVESGNGDRGYLSRRRALQGIATVGSLAVAGCSSVPDFGGVEPLWSQSIPEASATGPPAATDEYVLAGAQDKSLYAFGSEDGDQRFEVETGGPIETQPAVPATGGPFTVYSTDGDLYTVDTTGEQLWHEEGRTHRGRVNRFGSLLVAVAPTMETVLGLDAQSGSRRFERTRRTYPVPAVADTVAVVPVLAEGNRSQLVAFDLRDGTARWRTAPEEYGPLFAAAGDLVVTASQPMITAHDARDGTVRWETEIEQKVYSVFGPPFWFGRDIYIHVEQEDKPHRLYALDRSDGTVRWRQSAGYEIEGVAPVDDGVYVASSVDNPDGGILVRLDRLALDGSRQWQVTTELQIGGTIEAIGRVGEIVFVASEHAVAAFDPENGNRRWFYEPESRLHVMTAADRLYVSFRDKGGVARLPTR